MQDFFTVTFLSRINTGDPTTAGSRPGPLAVVVVVVPSMAACTWLLHLVNTQGAYITPLVLC